MHLKALRQSEGTTIFDRYIMVDWSSSTQPSAVAPRPDAIWVGDLVGTQEATTHYCRTRHAATELVRGLLRESVAEGHRVLVGFDFAFAYPAGFARAACLEGNGHPPWLAVWHHLNAAIDDDLGNRNNRFEVAAALNARVSEGPGPFWGCPKAKACATLTQTHKEHFSFAYEAPDAALERLRLTERHMKGVQDTWKLMAIGSVGGQVLVGIPRVHQLRFDPHLAEVSAVWPLETGFSPDPLAGATPGVLFAEIWPGIVDPRELAKLTDAGLIRDQAQVQLMCEWARNHDRAGTLGALLDTPAIEPGELAIVAGEEGWILGCTAGLA